MAYEIIDWVIDSGRIDYGSVLANRQTVASAMQSFDDGTTRVRSFMRNSDYLNVNSDRTGRSLSGEIENANNSWRQTLLTEIQEATTQDEVDQIRDTLNTEGDTYEEDTVNDLRTQLSITEGTLLDLAVEERREDEIDDIENIINNAEHQEDISIPSIGDIRRRYGQATASRISGLLANKNNQLESLDERARRVITDQIETATTTGELDRIDITQSHTIDTENALQNLLDRRRSELE